MMTKYLGAAAIGLLLGAATVRAQDSYNLRAAQEHLQAAWDNLKDAPADDRGHRDRAVSYVNKALEEIHLALAGDRPQGHLAEKGDSREQKLQRKQDLREQRLREKAEQRNERMEER